MNQPIGEASPLVPTLSRLQESEARYRRRSAELESLHDVSLRLNSQIDTAQLLQLILDQAVALLGVEAGLLFLYDPVHDELLAEIASEYLADFVGIRLKRGEGMAGQVFDSRHSLVISDYPNWPGRLSVQPQRPLLRNLLAVPLIGKDGVLGVLDLGSEQREFGDHDVWLAEMLAAQAAVALESARLLARVERQARETAALNRAGRAITSLLEPDAVLALVIAETQNLLNADGVWVLLCDEDATAGRELTVAASSRGLERLLGMYLPMTNSIAGQAVQTRGGRLVNTVNAEPRFFAAIEERAGIAVGSLLVAPLVVRDAAIGVLEASKIAADGFQPRDLAVFERMASTAAIAIDNARLLDAERRQFQQLHESQAQMVRVEKMAALGRMAAALAHEINNPLQAIQSHVELVMDFPLPPEQRAEFLGVVRAEISRLTGIVQRVLDFSRPALVAPHPVTVDELIRQTLALAGKQLQHHAVQVTTAVDAALTVSVGPDQIVQVLLNLVINAIEAIGQDGRIEIRASRDGDQALITCANDGPSIDEPDLPHVFEPFYTTKSDGTGLGLAVSQNLVEQYNGRLTVANRENGQGVIFTVQLPLA